MINRFRCVQLQLEQNSAGTGLAIPLISTYIKLEDYFGAGVANLALDGLPSCKHQFQTYSNTPGSIEFELGSELQ